MSEELIPDPFTIVEARKITEKYQKKEIFDEKLTNYCIQYIIDQIKMQCYRGGNYYTFIKNKVRQNSCYFGIDEGINWTVVENKLLIEYGFKVKPDYWGEYWKLEW